MQLGFVSAILPDLPLKEVLTFAAETGYECVEVMCWPVGKAERRYAGVTHIDVAKLDDAGVREIKELCASTGVSISGLGYYPNALARDEAEAAAAAAHIRDVISAAAKLELPVMNTFIGRDWTKSVDDNWPRFLETWRPIIQHAEDCGVKVAIENCAMLFTADEWPGGKNLAHSPAIWRRMYEDIPSENFGLNFDPSHFIWMQMDYLKAIREFSSRIFHAHAKDARVDHHRLADAGVLAHPLEYHTPKLPGLGDVDWGAYFAALADGGYNGPVCVEVEDRNYEGTLASRKASLIQCQRYLSQFTIDY